MCSYGLWLFSICLDRSGTDSRPLELWIKPLAEWSATEKTTEPSSSVITGQRYNSNSQFVWRACTPILMFWDCNPDSEAPKPVISFLLGWGHTLRFTIASVPWSVMRLISFGRRRKLYVYFLFMYSCTMKICKAVFTLIRADMHIYWLIRDQFLLGKEKHRPVRIMQTPGRSTQAPAVLLRVSGSVTHLKRPKH